MRLTISVSLKAIAVGLAGVFLSLPAAANFSEDFDSYATGSSLHGQGGWKGWDNNPAFTANTSSAQSVSAPNSVEITGDSDLVHEFSGYTSGTWRVSAQQYIPGNFSGTSYFILLNTYNDGAANPKNWSTQIIFDSGAGRVFTDNDFAAELNLIFDQWVNLLLVIDLDLNTQTFYYNGTQLFTSSWTEGISGGGAKNIAALDLFANFSSSIYYDNICISSGSCAVPEPGTLALLGLGLAGLGLSRRRKTH